MLVSPLISRCVPASDTLTNNYHTISVPPSHLFCQPGGTTGLLAIRLQARLAKSATG